ncbi:MAG TPA: alpha/beta hydrolase [Pseudonocardiaceae bacterium]|nr:alpha/beta hydrolase [Pseudonocardiaceae bacterium]
MTTTHTLNTEETDLVYDVRGPLPPADGRPALVMIGQPMTADGFATLAGYFPDRTVITYDPRGLGRSARKDGRTDHDPKVQAEDLHALVEALGVGPVEVFGSSGGAVTGLAWVTAHPEDIITLVAHEPPIFGLLPDAEVAFRAREHMRDVYLAGGAGAGFATFMTLTSWPGEFTDAYFEQPLPPSDIPDDGSRDDPLLTERSWAVSGYQPDVEALARVPSRVVIAVGVESENVLTGRTAQATAKALGTDAVVFPSHHGGFLGPEFGYPGQPEAFAARLREVLAG